MKERQTFLQGLILVVATLVLYWPVTNFPFVVIDDDDYVSENPWVAKGIGLSGLKWALSTSHAANWHPLTWVSHMLDYSAYGLFAGGHHLTSLLLHSLNTLLVFLVLKTLTKSVWPSFIVAGLFGWHPLHVESVAWVAERKDVLSTFFFLLAVWAYARYASLSHSPLGTVPLVEKQRQHLEFETPSELSESYPDSTIKNRKSKIKNSPLLYYLLALLLFALGLMSKPMLVTLPFVLLLLDYWPLQRLSFSSLQHSNSPRPHRPATPPLAGFAIPLTRLLWEKLPFFALSLGACVVTVWAQRSAGAVKSVEDVPLLLRTLNAPMAVVGYFGHTLCPTGLCVLYPLPKRPLVAGGILSALVIATITWFICRKRSDTPWAVTGWLWFLGTLVPVLGFVQVGGQAMADRYTYIPSIGLFLVMVWSAAFLLKGWRLAPGPSVAVALVPLIVCLVSTRKQLTYWRNSVSLCARAVAVTKENAFAENDLGVALAKSGKSLEAVQHYSQALRLKPDSAAFHYNLGVELAALGKADEAASQFEEALKLNPRSEILHNNLGAILAQQGKLEVAIEHFRKAMELNPDYPKAYLNYAIALQKQGEAGAAVTNYTKALQLDSDSPDALQKLAFLLATCPDPAWRKPASAIKLAERAAALSHHEVPDYLVTLATCYAAVGQFSNAVATSESIREEALQHTNRALAVRIERDLQFYRTNYLPPVDWRNP